MELVIGFIVEVILEIAIEIISNTNINKYVKNVLILIITGLYLSLSLFILYIGIGMLKEYNLVGILVILISLLILGLFINMFKKIIKINK